MILKKSHILTLGMLIAVATLFVVVASAEFTEVPEETRAASDNAYMATAPYIGSNSCGCHAGGGYGNKHAQWSQTIHANSVLEPDTTSVSANFSSDTVLELTPGDVTIGLDYNTTTENYTVTIDNVNYTVWRTLGSRSKQLYITAINNSKYVLPIKWNVEQGEFDPIGYKVENWFNITGAGMAPPKNQSWDQNCVGCHSTGTVVEHNATSGEWVATYQEMNIGCEACHGPGGAHNGNPANIWVPYDSDTCGRCHNIGRSTNLVGGETIGYPIHADGTQTFPGDSVYDYFVDGTPKWGDGENPKTLAQQYPAWLTTSDSGHAKLTPTELQLVEDMGTQTVEGFLERIGQWDGGNDLPSADSATWIQSCVSCHDPHNEPSVPFEESLLRLPKEDLCEECHTNDVDNYTMAQNTNSQKEILDGITAAGVLGKLNGEPGMLGLVECTDCHMPSVASSAVENDRTSHTFKPLMPIESQSNSMPDSCTVECHTSMSQTNAQGVIDYWNERIDGQILKAEEVFVNAKFYRNSAFENGTLSASINETYQRANFNYVLAQSKGAAVHNADFVSDLLADVEIRSNEVIKELSTGTITGTVTDGNQTLSGVYVVAGNAGNITDSGGVYVLNVDSMASYNIDAYVEGLGAYNYSNIEVGPGETVTHDFSLLLDTDKDGEPDANDTDDDDDGMPDEWEGNYSLNPKDNSDADLDNDGDGISNLDEFLGGTDPTIAEVIEGPVGETNIYPQIIIVLILIISFVGVLYAKKSSELTILQETRPDLYQNEEPEESSIDKNE